MLTKSIVFPFRRTTLPMIIALALAPALLAFMAGYQAAESSTKHVFNAGWDGGRKIERELHAQELLEVQVAGDTSIEVACMHDEPARVKCHAMRRPKPAPNDLDASGYYNTTGTSIGRYHVGGANELARYDAVLERIPLAPSAVVSIEDQNGDKHTLRGPGWVSVAGQGYVLAKNEKPLNCDHNRVLAWDGSTWSCEPSNLNVSGSANTVSKWEGTTTIGDSSIANSSFTISSDMVTLTSGYHGYSGGTTQFRDMQIADGSGSTTEIWRQTAPVGSANGANTKRRSHRPFLPLR